jgi:hypothetical protein
MPKIMTGDELNKMVADSLARRRTTTRGVEVNNDVAGEPSFNTALELPVQDNVGNTDFGAGFSLPDTTPSDLGTSPPFEPTVPPVSQNATGYLDSRRISPKPVEPTGREIRDTRRTASRQSGASGASRVKEIMSTRARIARTKGI